LFNKFATTKIANYLISIQFFRIYNRKSIVRKFEISRLILFILIKISKNTNKKEIKINRTIKIKIIIEAIILIIKNLVKNIENLKKEI